MDWQNDYNEVEITTKFEFIKKKIDERILNIDLGSIEFNSAFKYAMFPGRRFRPFIFLMLKYKKNLSLITEKDYEIAVAIEILHTTSIIVDDFVDDDSKRRNIDTFQKKYGPNVLMCFSHLMLSKAFEMIGNSSNKEILLKALDVYGKMAIGELGDISFYKSLETNKWLEWYKNIVEMKTGAIFGFCLYLSNKETSSYEIIGKSFGYFFQVANDFYDELYSDPEERGHKDKHVLNYTFPIACLLEICNTKDKELLLKLLKRRNIKSNEFEKLKRIYSFKKNREYIENKFKTIKNEVISDLKNLEPNEQKIINWALWKVEKSVFWNHNELKSAGY